ncbi:MAG: thioredoxin family protein [Candidatus Bathyarchaeia archaeon]|nr:thioredoxin fold domain-containing protein [Candidatus Bathyarchaeota archaeon]
MNSDQTIKIGGMNWKDEVLKAELPVVVEFFSPTCPYCQQLTPIFQKLSGEYIQKMKFGMVDTSKNSEIASGYGVMGVPTLKFFCAGRPIYEIVGLRSEKELREELEKALGIHTNCVSQSSPLYA